MMMFCNPKMMVAVVLFCFIAVDSAGSVCQLCLGGKIGFKKAHDARNLKKCTYELGCTICDAICTQCIKRQLLHTQLKLANVKREMTTNAARCLKAKAAFDKLKRKRDSLAQNPEWKKYRDTISKSLKARRKIHTELISERKHLTECQTNLEVKKTLHSSRLLRARYALAKEPSASVPAPPKAVDSASSPCKLCSGGHDARKKAHQTCKQSGRLDILHECTLCSAICDQCIEEQLRDINLELEKVDKERTANNERGREGRAECGRLSADILSNSRSPEKRKEWRERSRKNDKKLAECKATRQKLRLKRNNLANCESSLFRLRSERRKQTRDARMQKQRIARQRRIRYSIAKKIRNQKQSRGAPANTATPAKVQVLPAKNNCLSAKISKRPSMPAPAHAPAQRQAAAEKPSSPPVSASSASSKHSSCRAKPAQQPNKSVRVHVFDPVVGGGTTVVNTKSRHDLDPANAPEPGTKRVIKTVSDWERCINPYTGRRSWRQVKRTRTEYGAQLPDGKTSLSTSEQ